MPDLMAVYTVILSNNGELIQNKLRAPQSKRRYVPSHVYELCCGEVEFDNKVDVSQTLRAYAGLEKELRYRTMIVLRFGTKNVGRIYC